MTIAEQMIDECQGFVKGLPYEDLKNKALNTCDYDDQQDAETVSAVFKDGSRLVFWSHQMVRAD